MHWLIFSVLKMNKRNGFDLIKSNLPNIYQFYRNTLTNIEIRCYDIITNGIIDYKSIIYFSGIDLCRIDKIFNLIKLDHPLLFYVESLNVKYESHTKVAIINPQYRFDKQKTNNTIIALLSKAKSILVPLINSNDFYKEKSIHDYFCNNIHYDTSYANSSYECVGPMLFNKGVCEGISKAVKLLCDFSGLQCVVLHGSAVRTGTNSNTDAHTWNKIKINNCFYNLDVTFDLTISVNKIIRYDYFNLSDYEILKDHKSKEINLLPCIQSECYYAIKQKTFSTTKEIKKHFISSITSNKKSFVFKISSDANELIKEKEIIKCLNEALVVTRHFNQAYQYSFNDYQNVIQIDLI